VPQAVKRSLYLINHNWCGEINPNINSHVVFEQQGQLESAALNDFRSVLQVLKKTQPDEVYNLAGQTSVGLSFEQPVETRESIAVGTLNIFEVIWFSGEPIEFYNVTP
jgi:GDP-D-mannose dehydratase